MWEIGRLQTVPGGLRSLSNPAGFLGCQDGTQVHSACYSNLGLLRRSCQIPWAHLGAESVPISGVLFLSVLQQLQLRMLVETASPTANLGGTVTVGVCALYAGGPRLNGRSDLKYKKKIPRKGDQYKKKQVTGTWYILKSALFRKFVCCPSLPLKSLQL